MFRDLRVRSFSKSEGLSEDSVDAVLASRDGKIWLGNGEHIEALGPNGVPDTPKGAPKGNQSTYLLEDHLGRIWAGMDNTLWVFENRRFTQIRKQDGKPIGVVMGMTEDTDHNIWAETIGPPATLIRIRHMRIQEQIATPKLPLARKIVADAHTGIWLGLGTGDLARYRAGKLETFRFGETLKLKSVRYISSKQVDGSNHRAPKAC